MGNRCTSTNLPGRRKLVGIFLRREALLYDIKNYAYIEGDVMEESKMSHERHQVQDVGEDGNVDRVTRVLDLSHAECVEALFPYSKVEVGAETYAENCFDETEEYPIWLVVPDEFSVTTVNLLMKYIHEYMVCCALSDWLSITNPSAAANWAQKKVEMMAGIREAVNMRTRRVRRTLTPW